MDAKKIAVGAAAGLIVGALATTVYVSGAGSKKQRGIKKRACKMLGEAENFFALARRALS